MMFNHEHDVGCGLKVTAFLWSGDEDLSTFYRLVGGFFFIPLLICRWFLGKPVLLAEYIKKGELG